MSWIKQQNPINSECQAILNSGYGKELRKVIELTWKHFYLKFLNIEKRRYNCMDFSSMLKSYFSIFAKEVFGVHEYLRFYNHLKFYCKNPGDSNSDYVEFTVIWDRSYDNPKANTAIILFEDLQDAGKYAAETELENLRIDKSMRYLNGLSRTNAAYYIDDDFRRKPLDSQFLESIKNVKF